MEIIEIHSRAVLPDKSNCHANVQTDDSIQSPNVQGSRTAAVKSSIVMAERIFKQKQDTMLFCWQEDTAVKDFSSILHKVPTEICLQILSWVDPLTFLPLSESKYIHDVLVQNSMSLSWMLQRRQFAYEASVFEMEFLDRDDCMTSHHSLVKSLAKISESDKQRLQYVLKLNHVKKLIVISTQAVQLGFPSMLQTQMIEEQMAILWRFLSPLASIEGGPMVSFRQHPDAMKLASGINNFLANLVHDYLSRFTIHYPARCDCMHHMPADGPQICQWSFPERLSEELAWLGVPETLTKQFLLSHLVSLLKQVWHFGTLLQPRRKELVLQHFTKSKSFVEGSFGDVKVRMHRCAHNRAAPLSFSVAMVGVTYDVVVWGTRGNGVVELVIDDQNDYCGLLEGYEMLGGRSCARFEYWNLWYLDDDFELEKLFKED